MTNQQKSNSTLIAIVVIVGIVLFILSFFWFFISEGIWIIAIFALVILVLLYGILSVIRKVYPHSKATSFIEKRIEDIKEFILNLF